MYQVFNRPFGRVVRFAPFALFFLITLFPNPFRAQQTQVKGSILDANSKEAIGFANVFFQKSRLGAFSDENGQFNLISPAGTSEDTLVVSFLGYISQKIPLLTGQSQEIEVLLVSQDLSLEEVLIVPPAYPIIRKTINRKNAE